MEPEGDAGRRQVSAGDETQPRCCRQTLVTLGKRWKPDNPSRTQESRDYYARPQNAGRACARLLALAEERIDAAIGSDRFYSSLGRLAFRRRVRAQCFTLSPPPLTHLLRERNVDF